MCERTYCRHEHEKLCSCPPVTCRDALGMAAHLAENMEKVAQYIAVNNLTWDDFPAFKWCRDKGEGWYLPAIDEMLTVGHNYNGGTRVQNNRQARNKFNDALKDAGGKRMDRLVYYFSSTEMDEKNAYTTHMGIEPPYVIEIPKYNKFLVRAVHKF